MSPFFSSNGFNVPMFSWRDAQQFRASMETLKSTGANTVILDFSFYQNGVNANKINFLPNGTYASLDDLREAFRILADLGLNAWVKPVILTGIPPGEHITDWHLLAPENPAQWFNEYANMLVILGQIAEDNQADALLLGNELKSMTTRSDFRELWLQAISQVREVFSGAVGTNAKALDSGDRPSELQKIVFLDKLDFVGISAYPYLSSISDATKNQMEDGWHSDFWNYDRVKELKEFISAYDKPVYFTELSSPTVDGGNRVFYQVLATLGQGAVSAIPRDLAEQAEFFDASFSVLGREFGDSIAGVFGYNWHGNVSDGLIDIDALDDSYNWHLGGKPATDVISQWFSGLRTTSGVNLLGSSREDKLLSGFYDDILRGGGGNDQISSGSGNDALYGNGLPPINETKVELSIRGSGAIFQGIAPIVSIWIDGVEIGKIDVIDSEVYRTSDGQPWHGLDTYKFHILGGKEINSLRIVAENWAGSSPSSHRDFYIDSVSIDKIPLLGPWTLIRSNGKEVPGSLSIFADGYMNINPSAYNESLVEVLSDNDSLDGGEGIDIAGYEETGSNYKISNSGSTWEIISANNGTDTLKNIERLVFSDKKIALDLTPDGNAGKSLEFIGMLAYSMVKTPSVVGTILSIFDQGKSMKEVCQLAIDVGLTGSLAGSSSNLDLAKLVFRNVVGSEADAATANGLASYIQGSGGSMSQADFLTAIAGLELNQQHIGLVGLQSIGVEYII